MRLAKIGELFEKLPDSQIDIRVSLSSGPNGLEVDFVMERVDEWGVSSHLVSGIESSVVRAMKIMAETLENRAATHGLAPLGASEKEEPYLPNYDYSGDMQK